MEFSSRFNFSMLGSRINDDIRDCSHLILYSLLGTDLNTNVVTATVTTPVSLFGTEAAKISCRDIAAVAINFRKRYLRDQRSSQSLIPTTQTSATGPTCSTENLDKSKMQAAH